MDYGDDTSELGAGGGSGSSGGSGSTHSRSGSGSYSYSSSYSSSFSSSSSGFSDDVEMIIGEARGETADQPLVEPAAPTARRGAAATGEQVFMLEDTKAGGGGGAGPDGRLLLTESAHRAPLKSFLETIAAVPARHRTVAVVGALHHGKTAVAETLLQSAATSASLRAATRKGKAASGKRGGGGGHGQSGRTSAPQPHDSTNPNLRPTRAAYQKRADELGREMGVKTHVLAGIVSGAARHLASHLLTVVDTPGHPDLAGEALAGLRVADAALFCVDAVEGLLAHGEVLLRRLLLQERMPFVLVITKIDRLALELKLPPLDAYRKLRHVIDQVNNLVVACGCAGGFSKDGDGGAAAEGASETDVDNFLVSPQRGTVLFSSAQLGFCFSLQSFAAKYSREYPSVPAAALAGRLWGQVAFDKGKFVPIKNILQRPSFVTFVLEPLYKIMSHAVPGNGSETLSPALASLPASPLEAMREAVQLFCGLPGPEAIDALLDVLPTAAARNRRLAQQYNLHRSVCAGLGDDAAGASDSSHDNEELPEPVAVAVSPLLRMHGTGGGGGGGSRAGADSGDGELSAVVRVLQGRLERHSLRRLLSLHELSSESEPVTAIAPTHMFIRTAADGFIPVETAHAGQVVFLGGLMRYYGGAHQVIVASAADSKASADADRGRKASGSTNNHHHSSGDDDNESLDEAPAWAAEARLPPLSCAEKPALVQVSVQLEEPSKAERLLRGLQLLHLTSPGLAFEREETGEYTVSGLGEMHLDTAMYELRRGLCAGVPVCLSPPFISFRETVHDADGLLASAGTRHTRVECTAGALRNPPLVRAIEYGQLDFTAPALTSGGGGTGGGVVRLWTTLRRDYGLDALDASRVMALGPDRTRGCSLLIDDTLEDDPDLCAAGGWGLAAGGALADGAEVVPAAPLTAAQRLTIERAFRSTLASGPLVGEAVREVALRLVHARTTGAGPAGERELRAFTGAAMRQALLGARPRLMEPVLSAEILTPPECLDALREVLQMRRGALTGEEPIPGTALLRARALVPAIDSFGLETQIRVKTIGQAHPSFAFRQWDVVPGDPYDATVQVPPLEPARGHQLARDFVLKTRFRKGLSANLAAVL